MGGDSASARASFSFVREYPPADPELAHRHFQTKLSLQTDPADLVSDLARGVSHIVVVDVRSPQHFAECRIPGAVNLPYQEISEETTRRFPKEVLLVTYCWGPGCNAASKGAAKLSALGFQVKELIGGLEYWRNEDWPVEGTLGTRAPL
jgi:rhodanese-related sulfurtransferase